MSTIAVLWIALGVIAMQCVVICGFFYYSRNISQCFGVFATIVRDVHAENKTIAQINNIVQEDNTALRDDLARLRAQLLTKNAHQEKTA